jgi:hypothetical protein
MKTKFTSHGPDACSVQYFDEYSDKIVEQTFIRNVTYVFDGKGRQVCELLSSRGPTLMVANNIDLIDVIRREWKKARARDRAYARREAA